MTEQVMSGAAHSLAEFALGLTPDNIPASVLQRAGDILKDALGCAIFGARFPWSQMLADYLRSLGGRPEVPIPGMADVALPVSQAALLLGTMCHAYELDSLRSPGAGVHAGATVALPAFACATSLPDLQPERLLVAIVAGCEVMHRIGAATLHTPETRGFHAPGLTGAFGAATVVAVLQGLSVAQLTRAYGICGSLGGGLLAFAKTADGGMIKRLHLGRAAEAGATAAALAARGFEGPVQILEGPFGLLNTYCSSSDPQLLTQGLGTDWETLRTCFKRYAAHITAHGPVERLAELMRDRGIGPDDIEGITLFMSDKILSHHDIRDPGDIMTAQYSVPFMLAAALSRDIEDPRNIDDSLIGDPDVLAVLPRIGLQPSGAPKGWAFRLRLGLAGGVQIEQDYEGFSGALAGEQSPEWLEKKFAILTKDNPKDVIGLQGLVT